MTDEKIREIARVICKSRSCEGISCCQWPANYGRAGCPVEDGGYNDAARDVIAALPAGERDEQAAAQKANRLLAEAVLKFAPDLATELTTRRAKAKSDRDSALNRFLEVLRNAPTADAAPEPSPAGETWARDEIWQLREIIRDIRKLDRHGHFSGHEGEPWLRRVRAIDLLATPPAAGAKGET